MDWLRRVLWFGVRTLVAAPDVVEDGVGSKRVVAILVLFDLLGSW
jgi:hypothetical protein